ncbi:MAG: hypothetical protein SF028_09265 [Candidatus Sumerlaeia bacterium]|nr:hypothetical protein [Candidatus Sumerlaeia bacterium]
MSTSTTHHEAHQRALADLSALPSLTGKTENPFYRAELRRWRNRPLTYMGIGLLTAFLIGVVVRQRQLGLVGIGAAFGAQSQLLVFIESTIFLMLRPSAIIPAVMVWRALLSFRPGPFYEPFRTTFITPSQFIRGVIGVPVLVSAAIMACYVLFMFAETTFGNWQMYRLPQDQEWLREWAPWMQLASVFFEGAVNGFIMAVVACWAGLRFRLGIASIMAIGLFSFAIQGTTQLLWMLFSDQAQRIAYDWRDGARLLYFSLNQYYWWAAPKILLGAYLWWRCVRWLRYCREEDRPVADAH